MKISGWLTLLIWLWGKIYDYPNNGNLYHEILSKSYLTAFRYTERELLELLNMERSTFYDRKKRGGYASRRFALGVCNPQI